ncbi:MAG: adenylate/guanylate cyclase domain-containing protein [Ignavibacteriae bacterium]|nr:adenylate/guanylate cyclase domain-containing protein [Ignavibacteriota bacterium]MCB9208369.1 adenylate/guanylate cyclase domain-containing protein [Ignavibacteriales bacterium]MCB9259133.1 adenylate/guanylate cyclase domain-containing protein [Ignavibacteriales bacterium]
MTKNQFHKILFLLVYWIVAAIFYVFLEMAIEGYTAAIYGIYNLNYKYNFFRVLIIATSVVVAGGLGLAIFEIFFFNNLFRKLPFGKVLIIKTAFYFISIFILTSVATYVSLIYILNKSPLHIAIFERYIFFLKSPKVWALMLYWSFVVMSALFVLSISEKLGQGILLNYLIGKYHRPQEENRIFMFLDLISSTEYAEKLGHKKYSMLIQDCYSDLTDVVIKCHAQIYQYVGDEVVLTWESKKGIKNNNCINAFFEFEKTLKNREEHYKNVYGFVPQFKAGLNYGLVTVAEVGEMKKELAYHGDAINTAARIRSNCNFYNKKVLISADLLSVLHDIDEDYVIESVGICALKGKKNMVGVFSVELKETI